MKSEGRNGLPLGWIFELRWVKIELNEVEKGHIFTLTGDGHGHGHEMKSKRKK